MNFGLGVMLSHMRGCDASVEDFYGMVIIHAEISDEEMIIKFSNGRKIRIFDDGQSCCEHRYITCDDDVSCLIGGELIKIDVQDGDEKDEEYGGVNEWCFVEIATDEDHVKFTTHNEHNGYYGGFAMRIEEIVND